MWCVDSVPVGDSNYVTVYNGLDANVDDANTFRFSCFVSWMMDGRISCDFTSLSTVFQSYQDDGRMIMKGCVQWNPVYGSSED